MFPCSGPETCSGWKSEPKTRTTTGYWKRQACPTLKKSTIPEDIDCLVIVKLHHAQKKLERGFFTCASFKEYQEKSAALLAEGVIDQASLDGARIERYVIGPVFNLNFFTARWRRRANDWNSSALTGVSNPRWTVTSDCRLLSR